MFVNIKHGFHRNKPVSGVFIVVKPWTQGEDGGTITVKRPGADNTVFQTDQPRIKVADGHFFYCDREGVEADPASMTEFSTVAAAFIASVDTIDYEAEHYAQESEKDAMKRIAHSFDMLEKVTQATTTGVITGLIVSGPPGIGKSFGVEKVLKDNSVFGRLKNGEDNFEIISGAATPISVYQRLYHNRHQGFITVFDDCDSVLWNEDSLNLLKAALDSKKKRNICWLAESRVLKEEDIPDRFEFEGSIIFLTNVDFERHRGQKIADHLAAMISRCHYLDLTISTQRDQVLRIKQIVSSGMLRGYEFEKDEEAMIVSYIIDNASYMRELSLRMVKKIADLVKAMPKDWQDFAETTCLRRDARFKRLHAARLLADSKA